MAKGGPTKSDDVAKEEKDSSVANAARLRNLITGFKNDTTPRSPHELAEQGAARGGKRAKGEEKK